MKRSVLGLLSIVLWILSTFTPGVCLVERIASTGPYGEATCVELDKSRELLFVGIDYQGEHSGVTILDISDPASFRVVSKFGVPGSIKIPANLHNKGLAYESGHLYIATRSKGLRIYDVNDPAAPVEVAVFQDGKTVRGIEVRNSVAYVSVMSTFGLYILDVSDPSSPQELSHMDRPEGDIVLSGSHIYIAAHSSGFQVVDVSNPSSPQSVHAEDPGDIHNVYVHNKIACFSSASPPYSLSGNVFVYDVSDPANPVQAGFFEDGPAYDIVTDGSYAYLSTGFDFRILDITDPANIGEVSRYNTGNNTGSDIYYAWNSVIDADTAYVALGQMGVEAIDISNRSNPQKIGSYNTFMEPTAIDIRGNHAYVTENFNGLRIFDITDPEQPEEVGAHIPGPKSGYCADVFVSGSYAYVAGRKYRESTETTAGGLRILDINDPENPVEVSFYETPGYTVAVSASGDYAYVADKDAGLLVVNVANPASPSPTAVLENKNRYATDVYIQDNYAYITEAREGFRIVDISDPANPAETGYFETTGDALRIFVTENTAFLADGDEGLKIVDVSDPYDPVEISTFANTANWYSTDNVFVSAGYAYITGHDGLKVLDISYPANPTEVDVYINDNSEAADLYVSGFLAYLVDDDRGFSILRFVAPGIIDVHPAGLDISEPDGSAEFTVKLGSEPLAPVTIDLFSTNPGECRISPSTLTLDSNNWSTGAPATVTAEDDPIVDGEQQTAILTKPAISTDGKYNGKNPDNVFVRVLDNETGIALYSVYPTYGTENLDIDAALFGNAFIDGTTRIYISDYPGNITEEDITGQATFISSSLISLSIPGKIAGHYTLRAENNGESVSIRGAISFTDSGTIEAQKIKKAIIVASDGNFADGDLKNVAITCGNIAYKSLFSQGYTSDSIFYLAPEAVDVTGNGVSDRDGKTSTENFSYAVNYWAKNLDDPNDPDDIPPGTAAEELLIYMVGPGASETFTLDASTPSGVLEASTLAGWLDDLQTSMPGKLIVVYDACLSGSFLSPLKGNNRIVITGTKNDERAWFLNDGEVSFSHAFWTNIYHTADLYLSYEAAAEFIKELQTSWLDDDGDGFANRFRKRSSLLLGRARFISVSRPEIVSVSPPAELSAGNTSSTVWAGPVNDTAGVGIEGVWARLITPFSRFIPIQEPALVAPALKLLFSDTNDRYENEYDRFIQSGEYSVFIHASDKSESRAIPKLTSVTQLEGITIDAGDFNLDGEVGLADALIALPILTGKKYTWMEDIDYAVSGVFLNGKTAVDLAVIQYIFQKAAGMR